jgi:hypothetical protein
VLQVAVAPVGAVQATPQLRQLVIVLSETSHPSDAIALQLP